MNALKPGDLFIIDDFFNISDNNIRIIITDCENLRPLGGRSIYFITANAVEHVRVRNTATFTEYQTLIGECS